MVLLTKERIQLYEQGLARSTQSLAHDLEQLTSLAIATGADVELVERVKSAGSRFIEIAQRMTKRANEENEEMH